MTARVLLLVDDALPESTIEEWREVARGFATFQGESVELGTSHRDAVAEVRAAIGSCEAPWSVERFDGEPTAKAPMSAAEFVYREDGRPDWAAMWSGFCELALYGGPPHRGTDTALRAAPLDDWEPRGSEMIAEMRRGIYETTGLFAEPANPGWLAVSCSSNRMAAWLCACIILENVDAACDGEMLLVPAAPDFALKNEVKSVITVLAKTHHYWQAHIAASA